MNQWLAPRVVFEARRKASDLGLTYRLVDNFYTLVDRSRYHEVLHIGHSGHQVHLFVRFHMRRSRMGSEIADQELWVSIPASWLDLLVSEPGKLTGFADMSDRDVMISEHAWPEWPSLFLHNPADPTDIAWFSALAPKRWKVFRHHRQDYEYREVDAVLRDGWTVSRERNRMLT